MTTDEIIAGLTRRQKHILVALHEDPRPDLSPGSLSHQLGFRLGPYGHGSGAKRHSFSGFRGRGNWVGGSLRGLAAKRLVLRYYKDHHGYKDSFQTVLLRPAGDQVARRLVELGWTPVEVRDARSLAEHNRDAIHTLPCPDDFS